MLTKFLSKLGLSQAQQTSQQERPGSNFEFYGAKIDTILQRSYLTTNKSRKDATREIVKMDKELRYGSIEDAVQDHKAKMSGRLQTIHSESTDRSTRKDQPENRPCHGSHSQVHLLSCGHFVYCQLQSPCGSNCHESGDQTEFQCWICLRREYNWDAKLRNERWHDLLLPTFIDVDKEQKEAAEANQLCRKCEPAYTDVDCWIILPRFSYEVALIRAHEWQYEQYCHRRIKMYFQSYLAHLGMSALGLMLDLYEQLLCHSHEFNNVGAHVAASHAIILAVTHKDPHAEVDYKGLERVFKVSIEEDRHFETARSLINASMSLDLMEDFVKKAPKRLREAHNFSDIKPTAWRIWCNMKKKEIFLPWKLWDYRTAIVAGCLTSAMKAHNIKIKFESVCDILGLKIPEPPQTKKMTEDEKMRAETSWRASKESETRDVNLAINQQVVKFALSFDTKKVAKSHIEKRQARRRKKLAAQEIGGLENALATLGHGSTDIEDMDIDTSM